MSDAHPKLGLTSLRASCCNNGDDHHNQTTMKLALVPADCTLIATNIHQTFLINTSHHKEQELITPLDISRHKEEEAIKMQ